MKKNQLLTLAIVFGVLLSSCGSLSVSRMRYTKGEANISSIDNEKLNNNRFSRKEIKKALKNNSKLDVSNSVTSLSSQKDNISNASESNTPTILLVILSLIPILALIAIYLHQGEINIKFWIDLILHFLFLYSLYALLVVLDVL